MLVNGLPRPKTSRLIVPVVKFKQELVYYRVYNDVINSKCLATETLSLINVTDYIIYNIITVCFFFGEFFSVDFFTSDFFLGLFPSVFCSN